mgnify:CR=1 FL=1
MIIILQRLGSDHSHLFNSVDNIMKNYCERFLKLFSAYVFLQKKDFPNSIYIQGESSTDYWEIEYLKILEDGDAQINCRHIVGKCYNEMTTLKKCLKQCLILFRNRTRCYICISIPFTSNIHI